MELVKIREENKKYFNEDYIKGFETGTYIQYQRDIKEKTGRWIPNDNGTYSCSLCQSWIPNEQHHYARYCLHCGAKMVNENESL